MDGAHRLPQHRPARSNPSTPGWRTPPAGGARSPWPTSTATATSTSPLGNLGLNSSVRASAEHPARLWRADYTGDGLVDGLFTTFRDGADLPIVTVPTFQKKFPELRRRYPTATEFGVRTPRELFGDLARDADQLTASTFASAVAYNDGSGRFTLRPMPDIAQAEPVYALLADDVDGDGASDLLLGGGLLNLPPERGRYDAGRGLLLRGPALEPAGLDAGLVLDGQVRALRWARSAGGRLLVVARNDAPLQVLRLAARPAP